MAFNDYEENDNNPEFDRDLETDQILRQPPAAVGNPGASSLLDIMKSRFSKLDQRKTVYIQGRNKLDLDIWLEIETDISESELTEYRESSRLGNRANQRSGTAKYSEEKMHARLLVEKTVAVWLGNPMEDGVKQTDSRGDNIDLKHEEWLKVLKQDTSSVGAAIELFGYASLRAIGARALMEAGFGDEAEAVDPTRASSGV